MVKCENEVSYYVESGIDYKEITRADYVDLWVKNADLYKLVHYKQLAYMEAWVLDIKDDIAEIAGLSWDLG